MNNRGNRWRTLCLILALVVTGGCRDLGEEPPNDPQPEPPGTVSFRSRIIPIFQRHGCEGCHGGSGGLFLQTVASIRTGGDHGPALVPGNPDSSLIIRKLSPFPPFGDRMPQGGPYLHDTTLAVIRAWIAQGAPDN